MIKTVKNKQLLAVGLFLIAIALIFWVLIDHNNKNQSPLQPAQISDNRLKFQTYTDTNNNFSFEYPEGYKVKPPIKPGGDSSLLKPDNSALLFISASSDPKFAGTDQEFAQAAADFFNQSCIGAPSPGITASSCKLSDFSVTVNNGYKIFMLNINFITTNDKTHKIIDTAGPEIYYAVKGASDTKTKAVLFYPAAYSSDSGGPTKEEFPVIRSVAESVKFLDNTFFQTYHSDNLNIDFSYPPAWGQATETLQSKQQPQFVANGSLAGDHLDISFKNNSEVHISAITRDYSPPSGDGMIDIYGGGDSIDCGKNQLSGCEIILISKDKGGAMLFYDDPGLNMNYYFAQRAEVNLNNQSKFKGFLVFQDLPELEKQLVGKDSDQTIINEQAYVKTIQNKTADLKILKKVEDFKNFVKSITIQ